MALEAMPDNTKQYNEIMDESRKPKKCKWPKDKYAVAVHPTRRSSVSTVFIRLTAWRTRMGAGRIKTTTLFE
eukprot:COSAG02_NODE_15745_length_1144_cov_1.305263_2_plen_72_part_00